MKAEEEITPEGSGNEPIPQPVNEPVPVSDNPSLIDKLTDEIDKSQTSDDLIAIGQELVIKETARYAAGKFPEILDGIFKSLGDWMGPKTYNHSTHSLYLEKDDRLIIQVNEVDDEAIITLDGVILGGKTRNANKFSDNVRIISPRLEYGDHLLNLLVKNSGRAVWKMNFSLSLIRGGQQFSIEGCEDIRFGGTEISPNTHNIMCTIAVDG